MPLSRHPILSGDTIAGKDGCNEAGLSKDWVDNQGKIDAQYLQKCAAA